MQNKEIRLEEREKLNKCRKPEDKMNNLHAHATKWVLTKQVKQTVG